MAIKKLWVEKYRPKTMADVIMTSPQHRKKFDQYIANAEFPNMLLWGGPGTGKSTTSKALIRDCKIDRVDVLRINCSKDKIEAVRNKVANFASTMPLNSNFKVVQLEEFDGIGHDAQKLLRSVIEDTSSNCRFIATCNYINSLLPEMRSRFTQEFHFSSPSLEEVCLQSAEILMAEGIEFTVEDIEEVVALAYPDFRKVIQLLESSSIDNKLVLDKNSEIVSSWKLEVLELLDTGDFQKARKAVCTTASVEELVDVYRFLYNNLHKCAAIKKNLDQAFILIAQYQYQHGFVADPELQVAALFIELSQLVGN